MGKTGKSSQRVFLEGNGHFLQDRPHLFIKGYPFIKEFIIGNTLIERFSTGHKAFPSLKWPFSSRSPPSFYTKKRKLGNPL